MKKLKYPQNKEVGDKLQYSDRVEIARLSKMSKSYVRQVLKGDRNNSEIISWAKRLINDRILRLQQIENPVRKGTNLNES